MGIVFCTLRRDRSGSGSFPNGISQPVIALQDTKFKLFEAPNVYRVSGTDKYLLIIEAVLSAGRYFRSWTSTSIGGPWTPLANTESNPFAGASNVSFSGTTWTRDIGHGEMIRTGYDQIMAVSPCRMQYLYQGRDPNVNTGNYSTLPWRLALLTQTNSTC